MKEGQYQNKKFICSYSWFLSSSLQVTLSTPDLTQSSTNPFATRQVSNICQHILCLGYHRAHHSPQFDQFDGKSPCNNLIHAPHETDWPKFQD